MDDYPVLTTVAMALVLPYVAGTMLHHFLTRNWEKAIGWLLLFLFCLTTGLATLAIAAVEPGEFDPTIPFLNIAPWVMLVQAIFWGLFRFMNWRRRGSSGWRTVAVSACFVSLAASLLIPVIYNAIHQQRITQDRELMDEAGFIPYPGADFGDGKYEHKGGPGFGRLIFRLMMIPNSCLASTRSMPGMQICGYVEALITIPELKCSGRLETNRRR